MFVLHCRTVIGKQSAQHPFAGVVQMCHSKRRPFKGNMPAAQGRLRSIATLVSYNMPLSGVGGLVEHFVANRNASNEAGLDGVLVPYPEAQNEYNLLSVCVRC